jgi:hypothetical protein
VPWSSDPGSAKFPRFASLEYVLSHGPIPLTGPIRYFYDQQRKAGASALDALGLTKAVIIFGLGLTGLHAGQDYEAQSLPQAVQRQRSAQWLRHR